jgi:pimeloyl-ACP methyl ester carboxylesterase
LASPFVRDELRALPRGIGDVHAAIADRVFGLLGPSAAPVQRIHDTIARGVYETVAGGLWLGAAALPELRSEVAIAALNGLFGDRLAAEGSPLAIPMQARRIGPVATPHLVVFVHGLGETEHAWGSPNYGDLLPDVTPVFVRFNTGRHIAENGVSLDALMTELVREREVERITLIGHSMGGLVARSACHHGSDWTRHVRHVITLGTPHDGAPLEQAVHALGAALHLAPETRPFARLLRRRSAGIRDLRRGIDVPLLASATHCFVSATITRSATHPAGRVLGDMLVLAPSASGRRVGFLAKDGLTLGGTHHLALLNHPEVAARLPEWLR